MLRAARPDATWTKAIPVTWVGDVDVDMMLYYETRHNNQPPSLLSDNPMQQYDVIFRLRLELRHAYERIHNNSSREPMTIYDFELGRDTTQYTSRFCAFQSSSRIWIVVAMRSASGSESIGPILIEHEPSYDGVCVEGRLRAHSNLDISPPKLKKAMPREIMKFTMTMDRKVSLTLTIGFATKFCI